MTVRKLITWISICLLLASCAFTNATGTSNQVTGEKTALSTGYVILVPQGLRVEAISSGEMDFDLYVLKGSDGKILSKLYLGNAPDTSLVKRNRYLFSNFKTSSFKGIEHTKPCGVKTCGEVLVYLNDKKGWPQFAHIFFNDLTNEELQVVENIVHSLSHE